MNRPFEYWSCSSDSTEHIFHAVNRECHVVLRAVLPWGPYVKGVGSQHAQIKTYVITLSIHLMQKAWWGVGDCAYPSLNMKQFTGLVSRIKLWMNCEYLKLLRRTSPTILLTMTMQDWKSMRVQVRHLMRSTSQYVVYMYVYDHKQQSVTVHEHQFNSWVLWREAQFY